MEDEEKFNLIKPRKKTENIIEKIDYTDISLDEATSSNLDKDNTTLVFNIGQTGDILDIQNTKIICDLEVTVAANKNVSLENNFFAKCFSEISFYTGTKRIDNKQNMEIIDTMMKLLTIPKDYSDSYGSVDGWIPDHGNGDVVDKLTFTTENPTEAQLTALQNRLNKLDFNEGFVKRQQYFTPKSGAGDAGLNKFRIEYPLRYLIPLLDHDAYNLVFANKIELKKDINKARLFYSSAGTVDADVNISFKQIFLRIPKIQPTSKMQELINEAITSSKISYADVLSRDAHTTVINSDNFTWNITSGLTNLPSYMIIGFKPLTAESLTVNNSKFQMYIDADNFIKTIQVVINGEGFPITPMQICDTNGFLNNDSYDETYNTAHKLGNIFIYNVPEYRSFASILAIDLTHRKENATLGTNSVSVKVTKKGYNCNIYATLLTDATYQLNYKDKTITLE